MGLRGGSGIYAVGRFGVLLSLVGCAGGGSGTGAAVARDPAAIIVATPGGSWEVRRSEDVRLNQRLTVTRDEAWSVLPRVFEDLDVEVDVRDVAGRRLGASAHRFGSRILGRDASDFFDCGMDPGLNRPLAGQMPITAQVVTDVMASGAGAELRTTVQGTARRSGGNAGVATCRSTGLLEVLIGEMVQQMASSPG